MLEYVNYTRDYGFRLHDLPKLLCLRLATDYAYMTEK